MSATIQFDASSAIASIQDKTEKLMLAIGIELNDIIGDGVLKIHADAVRSIAAHGSVSKVVHLYNPKRDHEVSEAGNAPNTDLGTLVQSIAFDIDKDKFSGVVGTNLKYGEFLELGTAKMAARPWLFPAYEGNRDAIVSALKSAVADVIKGAGK